VLFVPPLLAPDIDHVVKLHINFAAVTVELRIGGDVYRVEKFTAVEIPTEKFNRRRTTGDSSVEGVGKFGERLEHVVPTCIKDDE
jgi:hypothetical protein